MVQSPPSSRDTSRWRVSRARQATQPQTAVPGGPQCETTNAQTDVLPGKPVNGADSYTKL